MIWSSSAQMTLAKGHGVKFFCWLLTRAHHNQQIVLCSSQRGSTAVWMYYDFSPINQTGSRRLGLMQDRDEFQWINQGWITKNSGPDFCPDICQPSIQTFTKSEAITHIIHHVGKYNVKDHPSNRVFFTHPVFYGNVDRHIIEIYNSTVS